MCTIKPIKLPLAKEKYYIFLREPDRGHGIYVSQYEFYFGDKNLPIIENWYDSSISTIKFTISGKNTTVLDFYEYLVYFNNLYIENKLLASLLYNYSYLVNLEKEYYKQLVCNQYMTVVPINNIEKNCIEFIGQFYKIQFYKNKKELSKYILTCKTDYYKLDIKEILPILKFFLY